MTILFQLNQGSSGDHVSQFLHKRFKVGVKLPDFIKRATKRRNYFGRESIAGST
jgi:hypothetical protein